MEKWLGSRVGKVLGIVLSCLSLAGMAVSLLWMAAVSSVEPSDLLLGEGKENFFKSGTYQNLLWENIQYELSFYGEMQLLDNSGTIDRDVLVDILDYDTRRRITGKNINGLAYTLGELLDWKEKLEEESSSKMERIVVCVNPYGDYSYYYIDDLREQIEENGWDIERDAQIEQYEAGEVYEGETTYDRDGGYVTPGSSGILPLLDEWEDDETEFFYYEYPDQIVDKVGNVVFTSFTLYTDLQIKELYKPQGASSLLEVVNENQWELLDTFYMLNSALEGVTEWADSLETLKNEHTQESNVHYLYVDLEQGQAYLDGAKLVAMKKWREHAEAFKQMGSYTILTKGSEGSTYDSNMNSSEDSWRHWVDQCLEDTALEDTDYVFAVSVDTGLPIQDWLYTQQSSFSRDMGILRTAVGVCISSTILFAASLIWLTLSAGRGGKNEKGKKIALNFFDRWKTGAAALLVIIVWLCFLAFFQQTGIVNPAVFSEYLQSSEGTGPVTDAAMQFYTFVVIVLFVIVDLLFLWGYLSFVRRCKARTLWKNSILRVLLRQGKRVFFALKDIPRKAVALGGFLCIQAFLLLILENSYYGNGFLFFCLFLTQAAGIGWIVKLAVEYQKIQKGVRKIASGDIAGQIPTRGLTFDRKTLAENINQIGAGLDKAVEESLRSERLKTELITNVSHDIKTPLTSIINYVDLLKREDIDDEKVQGYLDILEKKSQQLKTLTEDVVEASKASTGNLKLDYEDLDLVEMVLQVNGEFQEKFGQQDLELISRLPEEPVVIRADGRRVWRILENVYQNVYKYALPHTRVYVGLEAEGLRAVFTLKNISQQPLDISPDELTERFIQGDSSRNTQGSGLGLSIAKSLTELQSGEFQLYLDGDLFKVWIAFPLQDPEHHKERLHFLEI